ncbi:MAG: hypothetical protein HYZ83_01720, partial [Candidatus Omnitrophica bacterium]|nr:hypothetical protein [Candidatus Omnitrophota bacterium]
MRISTGDFAKGEKTVRIYLTQGDHGISIRWNNQSDAPGGVLKINRASLRSAAMSDGADLDRDGQITENDIMTWLLKNPDQGLLKRASINGSEYTVVTLPSGSMRFSRDLSSWVESSKDGREVTLENKTYLVTREKTTGLLVFEEKLTGDINLDGNVTESDLAALTQMAALESYRIAGRDFDTIGKNWTVTADGSRFVADRDTQIDYTFDVRTDGDYELGFILRNTQSNMDWYRFELDVMIDGSLVETSRIASQTTLAELKTIASLKAGRHTVRYLWKNNRDSITSLDPTVYAQNGPARLETDGLAVRAKGNNSNFDKTGDGIVNTEDVIRWVMENPTSAASHPIRLNDKTYFVTERIAGQYVLYDPAADAFIVSEANRSLLTVSGKDYVVLEDAAGIMILAEHAAGDVNLDGSVDSKDWDYAFRQASYYNARYDGRDYFSQSGSWIQQADGSIVNSANAMSGIEYRFDVPETGYYEIALNAKNSNPGSAEAHSRMFIDLTSDGRSLGRIRLDAANSAFAEKSIIVFLEKGIRDIDFNWTNAEPQNAWAIKNVTLHDGRYDRFMMDLLELQTLIPETKSIALVDLEGTQYFAEKRVNGTYRFLAAQNLQATWIESDSEGRKVQIGGRTYLIFEVKQGADAGKVSLKEWMREDINLDGAVTVEDFAALIDLSAKSQARLRAIDYTQIGGISSWKLAESGTSLLAQGEAGGLQFDFKAGDSGLYNVGLFLKDASSAAVSADYRFDIAVYVDGVHQANLRSALSRTNPQYLETALKLAAGDHKIEFIWRNP